MPDNDSAPNELDLAASAPSTDPNDRAVDASPSSRAADAPAPPIKDHPAPGEPVAIPEHLAESFPPDTTVVKHESGELVANIPAEEGGGWYRIVVEATHGIEQLAALVAAFRGR